MHAWVDVGDGIPLSEIKTRRVLGFGGTCELPIEEVTEKISLFQLDPVSDEEEQDERPALLYKRFMLPSPPPFKEWQATALLAQDEHYQKFNDLWKEVSPVRIRPNHCTA